mmetsp:Transcript_23182/g.54721  ORF Transcript_23182/g.54721 Transcript_23182/m.54721 type:complete len:304 (-) Transcript_23182:409-1320(-)
MPRVTLNQFFILLLVLSCTWSSCAFMESFGGRQQKVVTSEIRPDLQDVVDRQCQDNTQLDVQLHVGDEDSGFLTIQNMIIQLGGPYDPEEADEFVKLPGKDGALSKFSSGGHRLNILSKGQFVNMDGLQHIDCQKGCWEMCWMRGRPAGTIVFAFSLPETYSRNKAFLPKGNLWMSFPLWTTDGLKYGQAAKQKVLDEMEFYTRKWNEELAKYQLTKNPIMKAIHERNAHMFAEKCDHAWDYSLATIPDDDECLQLQEDLLLSKRGLLWMKNGNDDVLLGDAVASPSCKGSTLSSFSNGKLRP